MLALREARVKLLAVRPFLSEPEPREADRKDREQQPTGLREELGGSAEVHATVSDLRRIVRHPDPLAEAEDRGAYETADSFGAATSRTPA